MCMKLYRLLTCDTAVLSSCDFVRFQRPEQHTKWLRSPGNRERARHIMRAGTTTRARRSKAARQDDGTDGTTTHNRLLRTVTIESTNRRGYIIYLPVRSSVPHASAARIAQWKQSSARTKSQPNVDVGQDIRGARKRRFMMWAAEHDEYGFTQRDFASS